MKSIIVYSSQTGFTRKYAEWLAQELGAVSIPLGEAQKKGDEYFEDADAIVYGGWVMGGKIVNGEWFAQKAPAWKGKKLAMLCVGASPEDSATVDTVLQDALQDGLREEARAFYCPGGIAYERMKLPSRLLMKAFAAMMRNKKDASAEEKSMGEMLAHSYDISDKKYILPILQYLQG